MDALDLTQEELELVSSQGWESPTTVYLYRHEIELICDLYDLFLEHRQFETTEGSADYVAWINTTWQLDSIIKKMGGRPSDR